MEKLLNDFKINFTKGDTYALAVKIKNISEDLGSAYFTVKENPEDSPLIQKTLGAGISKIDDRAYKNEKTYKIQLQSEDTANLEPLVQYLYDVRVAVGNVVKTLLSGVFVVNHSVSEVSTTITSTLEVVIDDVVESEASTTAPTSGIEYEQDPVAMAKIGDMKTLATTNKDTLVKAINEAHGVAEKANAPTFTATSTREEIASGETQQTLWGKVKKWFADLKALAFKDKVETGDITDKAVTMDKIGDGAISTNKFADDAICPDAMNAKKVNNLEIVRTEDGVLKIGDTVIPQRKLLWTGYFTKPTTNTAVKLTSDDWSEKKIEVEFIYGENAHTLTLKGFFKMIVPLALEGENLHFATAYIASDDSDGVYVPFYAKPDGIYVSRGSSVGVSWGIKSVYEIIEDESSSVSV